MTTVLLIEKNSDIVETKIKNFAYDTLYKKCRLRKPDGFKRHALWNVKVDGQFVNIACFGKDKGKSGNENKYDMPPPVDATLFFGPLLLVRLEDDNDTPISLSIDVWNKVYEKLFGGFEDLCATAEADAEEEDELANIPAHMKTKNGYLKDDFIVEDHSSNPSSATVSEEEIEETGESDDSDDNYESELDFEEYEYMNSSGESDYDEEEEEEEESVNTCNT